MFCPCRSLVAPYRRNFPHPCPPSGDPFVRTEVPTSTVAKPHGGLSGAMLGSTNNISHPRGSLFDDDVGLEEKEQLETFPQPVVTSDSMASPPQRVVSHIICWRMLRRAMWPFGLFDSSCICVKFVSIGLLTSFSRVSFSVQTPSPLPFSEPSHDVRGSSQVRHSCYCGRCVSV